MAIEEPRAFGDLLRRYRLAAGLTQEALAEQAGLSVRGIADLERGARRFPYPETVQRLADSLQLTSCASWASSQKSRANGRTRHHSLSKA
ncbi:MAG TPA: helix-turn-helix transcriptional regulator [Chloroflexota bacterium]|nr:helix-turn-helix transcriptional regulator [Chloroflexota bacterium]